MSLALAFSALGCGKDDDPQPAKEPVSKGETTGQGPTATAPDAKPPPPDATAPGPAGSEHRKRGESQPGGAGDEDGARAPAMFTGKGGRITPAKVQVPPFLAVRAELRSADGRSYSIRFGGHELRSGRSLQFPGLRPGTRLTGEPQGAGGAVVIEASAEPGP